MVTIRQHQRGTGRPLHNPDVSSTRLQRADWILLSTYHVRNQGGQQINQSDLPRTCEGAVIRGSGAETSRHVASPLYDSANTGAPIFVQIRIRILSTTSKKLRKTLNFSSLKFGCLRNVNVRTVGNKHKKKLWEKIIFCWHLESH